MLYLRQELGQILHCYAVLNSIYCVVKTALTSEALLKPNCIYNIDDKSSYKT